MSDDLTFGISLEDLVSGPAHKAAQAVDKLSNELTKAKGQLANFEAQLKHANEIGDVAGHERFSAAVAGSSLKVSELGARLGHVKEQGPAAASALEQVAAKAPGIAKVALAVAAVGIAVGGVLYEIGKAGVEMALEVVGANKALEATFDALGKGPDAGKRTVEMLDDVARQLPQSREELAKWTREIEKMGVTDLSKVRNELLATASAQAILGEGGDAAYGKISRKVHDAIEGHHKLTITSKELTRTIGTNLADAIAKKMGMSLETLEQKLKAGTVDASKFGDAMEDTFLAKGGKGLDAMWLRTGQVTKKLRESFGELFKDVDTGPITDAMRNLLVLFDQTQPSGQAMKGTLTDVFNSVIKVVGSAITEAEVFFLTLEVYALSAKLALKPFLDILVAIDDALTPIVTSVPAPGSAPAAQPKSASAMALGASLDIANPMAAIAGWVGGVGGPSNDVGAAVGNGLIAGMLAKLGIIDATGQQLGEAAVAGTKTGAGAHSPSVPAIEIGGYLAQGLSIGMVESPLPERAGRQMGGYALGGLASAAAPANGNGGGGGMSISGLTIHIMAPHGVTDVTALSAAGISVALERLQLASGR